MGTLIGIIMLLILGLILAILLRICDTIYTYYQRHRKPKLSAWDKARIKHIKRYIE